MASLMKLYLISDNLTHQSLLLENIDLQESWWWLRKANKPILFVESAWNGYQDRWKFQIAAYPDYPERNNQKLIKLVEKAKSKGIPTVFWNKEDSVHFDRFIDSAKHFDHIFTVDANCVERYRAVVPTSTTVGVAMFPVQPRIHYFKGFEFKHHAANFVGSYSKHIHDIRRERQEMLFEAAKIAKLPITVFDRNSDRKSDNYRYPADEYGLITHSAVEYHKTADIYRDYLISLNVNTIEDSPTMYSRRVVEILACSGILVTTPAMAVDKLFSEYCHTVHNIDEATELLARLKYGPSTLDLERAKAGSNYVLSHFTWRKFLERIQATVGY